jgi:hypothetical protein
LEGGIPDRGEGSGIISSLGSPKFHESKSKLRL